ncbi:uncharacterized protein DEA37_0008245 [Paragonimus westermani]|uniref:Oxidation resistance protein 1 n=1 Tax=Paragonimus westermani TaxID=34504 RepID=A0A5J4NLU3_9TREM|nr:uncharacterized protein DEA37_0008245 [Paragonimus westermani]
MESSSDGFCVYEVRPGDSLSGIAAHFGYVTPTQLARINKLSLIGCGLPPVFPGQRLIVPQVSKSGTDTFKVRRAPGAALRVTALPTSDRPLQTSRSVESDFILQPDFYAVRSRANSNRVSFAEDSEKQFVKVVAQRVLSSGELIDGVLLITPDSLCFDATVTAVAQKRAFLATHPSISSESNGKQDKTVCSEQEGIAKELLELGVCVPLETLSSMCTLKKLVQHANGLGYSSWISHILILPDHWLAHSGQRLTVPESYMDQRLHVHLWVHVLVECGHIAYLFLAVPPETSCVTDEDGYIVTGSDLTSRQSPQVDAEVELCSQSSLSDGAHSPSHPVETFTRKHSFTLEAENALFLRVVQFSSGKAVNEYHFQIITEEIAKVYAFLLRAGVRPAYGSRELVADRYRSDTADSLTSVDDRASSCTQRSLVEEALEDMQCASPAPELYGGFSGILSDDMLFDLGSNFPTHWIGANLQLIYKTEQDGYSLGTLYRKSKNVEGGVLLVIRDTLGIVFGAILSERIQCSKHFYGTGETCVFHWCPDFKRYDWTKKNYFFMRGSANSFQIGGQSGRNAIWFDEALKYGRSEPTDTFDNPVLSGSLPAFQFASLSLSEHDSNLGEDTGRSSGSEIVSYERSTRSQSRTSSTDHEVSAHAIGLDSVPFLIDSLEAWELIS